MDDFEFDNLPVESDNEDDDEDNQSESYPNDENDELEPELEPDEVDDTIIPEDINEEMKYNGGDDDDNEEDEDDIDEDELNSTKKIHLFNKEVNMDYIKTTHPECLPINMDELKVMLPVIRNANGIIIDDFHTTIPILTKYEKTRVIGQRASMIEHGAIPFIKVPSHIIDSAIIAEMELNAKKIPFIIKRPLPNNGFEYWRLSDLELIL